MPIVVACDCGKKFRVADKLAGRRFKCPACGEPVSAPATEEEEAGATPPPLPTPKKKQPTIDDDDSDEMPRPKKKRSPEPDDDDSDEAPQPKRKKRSVEGDDSDSKRGPPVWQNRIYWALAIALVPLAFALLSERPEPVEERFFRTLEKAPQDTQQSVKNLIGEIGRGNARIDDVIGVLPDGRLEGAFLSRSTGLHWLFGLVAAGGFLGLGLFLFSSERASPTPLILLCVFTATIGIVLLFAAQFLAMITQGRILISRNIIILLLFWLAWAIGFSYRAALDPDIGFVPSLLGFTFGVGFLEEVCKALPILYRYRTGDPLTWRGAATWGFASGIGFGVSEGIMYSADFYNGIASADMYLVRFVSCVALHAIWTASAACFIHKYQDLIHGAEGFFDWVPRAIALVAVPMVLHGLYDTFLKKELEVLALVTGIASFAWLVYSVEKARSEEDESEKPRKRRRAKLREA